MKTKREIALEIFNLLEDEDIINFNARPLQETIFSDSLDLIECVLEKYLIIEGRIVE